MTSGPPYEIDYTPSESKREQVMAAERVRRLAVEVENHEAQIRRIMDGPEGLVQQIGEAVKAGVPIRTLSAITGINDGRIEAWTGTCSPTEGGDGARP